MSQMHSCSNLLGRKSVIDDLKFMSSYSLQNETRFLHHSLDQVSSLTFSSPGRFPLSIFAVTERGPSVIYKDFVIPPTYEGTEDQFDVSLQKMAINYISAIGSGHDYIEGCFDLPAGTIEEYRVMLICFRLYNPTAIDTRLRNGFYQIAMFVKKDIAALIPALSSIESGIIAIAKSSIRNPDNIIPSLVGVMKKRILSYIGSEIRKAEVTASFDSFPY